MRSIPTALVAWLLAAVACVAGVGCILGPKQDDPTPSAVADSSVGGGYDGATASDTGSSGSGCDDKTGAGPTDATHYDACPFTDAAADSLSADAPDARDARDADAAGDAGDETDGAADAPDDAGEAPAG